MNLLTNSASKEVETNTLRESPIELLGTIIQESLIKYPSQIDLIRKNAWPIMMENNDLQYCENVQTVANIYKIPSHVIAEILSNAQMIWFLSWAEKTVSEETAKAKVGLAKKELIEVFIDNYTVPTLWVNELDLKALDKFFATISNTQVIQSLQANNIKKEAMPRGLIRQISLFDMDYKNSFSTLKERLKFIELNILEQDKILGEDYSILIQENGGIPVDHIVGKETTMLSREKYFGKISTICYNNQYIDVLMRVIPGFSPVWLDILFWLDLPQSNQNYFASIWLYFAKEEEETIPIIHTIQLSTHNIWNNGWQLVWIKEPYDSNVVSMEERMKIISWFTESIYDIEALKESLQEQSEVGFPIEVLWLCDHQLRKSIDSKINIKENGFSITAWPDKGKIINKIISSIIDNIVTDGAMPLLIATIEYLFANWYPKIIIQNGGKNLRLQKHTQDRKSSSITESSESLYAKKARKIWGIINDNTDYIITPSAYFSSFSNSIYGHRFLKTEALRQGINNVFSESHPATTKLLDITNETDLSLFNAFINSSFYDASKRTTRTY